MNTLLQDYAKSDGYGQDICFALTFQSTGENGLYAYTLSYNVTTQGGFDPNDVPDTLTDVSDNFTIDAYETQFLPWVNSGFVKMQALIDNLILQQETGNSEARIHAWVAPDPLPSYRKDDIYQLMQGNFP